MAERESAARQSRTDRTEKEDAPVEEAQSDIKERHEKLSDDVDALLDDIDDVLEENAEEFVRGYVQKGGE
jgi:prokaryotic ubiquitin-like protein Pup